MSRCAVLHIMRNACLALLLLAVSWSANTQIVTPAMYNGKWGFIDLKGDWFIEPQFESVSNFYNYYAGIAVGEKEGLIDQYGKVVIEPTYDFVGLVDEDMVDLMQGEMTGYMNVKTGHLIPPQFEDGNEFAEGLAAVMNDQDMWGFIDKTGQLVIPFKYDDVDWYFENDSIKVTLGDKEFYINKKDEHLGDVQYKAYVKKELSLSEKRRRLRTMNPGFDTLAFPSTGYRQDSLFWYRAENGYGLADTTGRAIVQPIYDYIWYFSEGMAPVNLNGQWGFIYPNGEIAIELEFQEVKNFKHGLAAAQYNGKWGYINHEGEWIIDPVLEAIDGNFRHLNAKSDPVVFFAYE